jgi:DNA-binding PadR family transcriptional regulator
MRHGGFGGARAQRGFVKAALLVELLDGPGHGYALGKRIESKTGGRWSPGPGSIYPTLVMLSDRDLVTSTEEEGKTIYALTDEGTEAAEEARERFEGRFDDSGATGTSVRSSGMALFEVLRSLGRTANEEQSEKIRQLLDETRKQVLAILAE